MNNKSKNSKNVENNLNVTFHTVTIKNDDVEVTTEMTDSVSNSTVTVNIETDDNEDFSSAKTTSTVGRFSANSAGTKLSCKIPAGSKNGRYVRILLPPVKDNVSDSLRAE